MKVHLVTFADESMSRSAVLCANSAADHGTDYQWLWTPCVLRDTEFYWANRALLDQARGCGFWAWKPFIVHVLLNNTASPYLLKDGDVVIYADAGIEFIDNINYIIDRMDQDIFLFGNMYDHAHWCKRDIVEAIWPLRPPLPSETVCYYMPEHGGRLRASCGEAVSMLQPIVGCSHCGRPLASGWSRFGKQVQASVIFFRVNDKTRAFVKEWLDWCLFEGGRLIDDSPSRTPNHPEFRENRHDQAILTTMAYRDGIPLNWWPAVYNDGQFTYPRGDYPDLGCPPLFHHHRKRNADWSAAA